LYWSINLVLYWSINLGIWSTTDSTDCLQCDINDL